MRKQIPIVIAIVIVLISVCFAFAAGAMNTLVLPSLIQPARGQAFSTQTVINSVRPLGQLTTYEAQFAKAGVSVSLRWGIAGTCYVGAKHAVQGTVRAAIDLTKLSERDIVYDQSAKRLILSLPSPTVVACSVDEIIQYDAFGATPLCNVSYDELRQVAQYIAINNFRDEAQRSGLLERAQSQAKVLIESFLHTLLSNLPDQAGVSVTAQFVPADQVTYDRACHPSLPLGWTYDAERNIWQRN
ncbi:MAG: DUF4230 domain-containing protein [Chloroflexi bacterium]|jgi:hypothetical protein|nr:DUF4230 domain-containing protein [Chloroflexota bacterium]